MDFKMSFLFSLTVLFTLTANEVSSSNDDRQEHVLCYFLGQATHRIRYGNFNVRNINPALCTHIVYLFASVDSQGAIIPVDPAHELPSDGSEGAYGQLNSLKAEHPHLKTLLAVGGSVVFGGENNLEKYTLMTSLHRREFINSTVNLLLEHGFDGLVLNWDTTSFETQSDSDNLTDLLKELREEFDDKKPGLLITAAVNPKKTLYDIPTLCRLLDIVDIKAFDMHGPWEPMTGHSAPLHSQDDGNSVENALNYWLQEGCPPEKLVLGIPTYGRTFTLASANDKTVGAPTTGEGIAGFETLTRGVMAYFEYDYAFGLRAWRQHYDEVARVPYAEYDGTPSSDYSNRDWVSYEDKDSVVLKAQQALKKKIAGVSIWTLDTDEFHQNYHLTNAVRDALEEGLEETTEDPATEEPSTTEAPTPTTPAETNTTEAPIPTTPAETNTTEAPIPTTPSGTNTTAAPIPTTPAGTNTTAAPIPTTPAETNTTEAPIPTTPSGTNTTAAPIPTTPDGTNSTEWCSRYCGC